MQPVHTAFDDAKADFLKDCETRKQAPHDQGLPAVYSHGTSPSAAPRSLTSPRAKILQTPREPLPISEKHHAFTASRRFFRYGVQHHLIDRSPMDRMPPIALGRPNGSASWLRMS